MTQPAGLLTVLADSSAPLGDRNDAAQDLSPYDEALPALVETAMAIGEDAMISESCGESIAEIWQRNSSFDQTIYEKLPLPAQREIALVFDIEMTND